MKDVMTVKGKVNAKRLGRVLMHEHFLFGFCGFAGDSTLGPFKDKEYMDICIAACDCAKAYGINTIIDATTNECGRNPEFLKRLSEKTGINIICSTGYYHESESAYSYWKFRSAFVDIDEEIYRMMLEESTRGIGDTGICAGVIKLASGVTISPMEKRLFLAAARVNREQDIPIITHTQLGQGGPQQAELLIEAGVNPKRVAIGHMCGNLDINYQESVLKQGFYVAFDRFGLEGEIFHTPTDEQRVSLLMKLIENGWENQILISHDYVNVELGRKRPAHPSMANANIGNIGNRVIPMLRKKGITEEQLEKLFVNNPQSLLGGV